MKKEFIIFSVAILMTFSFVVFVIADDNSTNVTNQTKITANWSKICAGINAKVDAKIKNFDENNVKYFGGFSGISNTVLKVEQRANVSGIDTSRLNNDLATLNQSVDKYKIDYSLFIQKLEATKNFTCGHSQGQFMSALADAKAELRIVKADVENIKRFSQTIIRTDIQTLRVDVRGQNLNNRMNRIENRSEMMNESLAAREQRLQQMQNRTAQMNTDREQRLQQMQNRTAIMNETIQERQQRLDQMRQRYLNKTNGSK